MVLQFDVPQDGRYLVELALTEMFEGGIYDVYLGMELLAKEIDTFTGGTARVERFTLGTHRLEKGTHRIRFDATGKDTRSKGYYLGLDGIILTPVD